MDKNDFKKTKYHLGLDLGVASLGWAVIGFDKEKDSKYLHDFGVRIWKQPVNRNGKSLTLIRRHQRSVRRLVRRRQHRISRLLNFLVSIKILEKKEDYYSWIIYKSEKEKEEKKPLNLKLKGLAGKKLQALELVTCLVNYAKQRGYSELFTTLQENKNLEDEFIYDETKIDKKLQEIKNWFQKHENISEKKDKDNATKKLNTQKYLLGMKNAMSCENKEKFPSEVIKDWKDNKTNKLFFRKSWQKEITELLSKQFSFHSQLNEKNRDRVLLIIFSQRYSEDGPEKNSPYIHKMFHNKMALSPFSSEEKKTTQHYTFWVLYKFIKIISLALFERVTSDNDEDKTVDKFNLQKLLPNWTEFAESLIYEFLKLNKLSLSKSREILENFIEKKLQKHISDDVIQEIKNKLKNFWTERKNDFTQFKLFEAFKKIIFGTKITKKALLKEKNLMNSIAYKMWLNFTLKKRQEEFEKMKKDNSRTTEEIDKLNKMGKSLIESQYSVPKAPFKQHMVAVINNFVNNDRFCDVNPYIYEEKESRKLISVSAEKLRKHKIFSKFLSEHIEYRVDNPVAFRSINQVRIVLKKLFAKYKNFDNITLEIGRDLNTKKEQETIRKQQAENNKQNKKIEKEIKRELGYDSVNSTKRLRYKLWKEQNFDCLYCNQKIEKEKIFSIYTHIDHIIPRTTTVNNSHDNLVLCCAGCNLAKGTELIRIWKGNKFQNWIQSIEEKLKLNKKKIYHLKLQKEDLNNFLNRDAVNNSIIGKFFKNYIEVNLASKNMNTPVKVMSGRITRKIRDKLFRWTSWGIEKDELRKITRFHHAIDAICIALMDKQKIISFITDWININRYTKFNFEKNEKNNDIDILKPKWKHSINNFQYFTAKEKNVINKIFQSGTKVDNRLLFELFKINSNFDTEVENRMPVLLNKTLVEKNGKKKMEIEVSDVLDENKYLEKIKEYGYQGDIHYPFISKQIIKKIPKTLSGEQPIKLKGKEDKDEYLSNESQTNYWDARKYYGFNLEGQWLLNKNFWKKKRQTRYCEKCNKVKIGKATFWIDENKNEQFICKKCFKKENFSSVWNKTKFITQNETLEWKINEHYYYYSFLGKNGNAIDLESLGLKNFRFDPKSKNFKKNSPGKNFSAFLKKFKNNEIKVLNISLLGKKQTRSR